MSLPILLLQEIAAHCEQDPMCRAFAYIINSSTLPVSRSVSLQVYQQLPSQPKTNPGPCVFCHQCALVITIVMFHRTA